MKMMIAQKNWSGVTISKKGHAWFKKVNYQLEPSHLKPNPNVDKILIYNPTGKVDWTFVAGKDMGGEGDCR